MPLTIHRVIGEEVAFDTGRGVTLATHDEIARKLLALERSGSDCTVVLCGSLVDWSDLKALSAAFDTGGEP